MIVVEHFLLWGFGTNHPSFTGIIVLGRRGARACIGRVEESNTLRYERWVRVVCEVDLLDLGWSVKESKLSCSSNKSGTCEKKQFRSISVTI